MVEKCGPADLLLFNGRVHTIDKNSSIQQGIAIRSSLVLAVGSNRSLKAYTGPNTRMIDLRGHAVIPGIIDGHAHMDREGLKTIYPDFKGARSIPDILTIVEREVKRKRKGEWAIFMPIGDPPNYADMPAILAEKRYPNRYDLDRVAPRNPVYIRGIWSPWNAPPSVSISNSLALHVTGITRNTVSPHASVVIERDKNGEPTGVIADHNIYPVTEFSLMRAVPRFTHKDRVNALHKSMYLYNSVGVTGIYEGHGVAPEVLDAYKELWDAGEMTVRSRLVVSPTWRSLKEAVSDMSRWSFSMSKYGLGDDMLRISGVFIDFRGHRHIARIRSSQLPYTGWAGFAVSCNPPSRFQELIHLAAQHNLRVNTIASSEEELAIILEAFHNVNREVFVADMRWVVEHVKDITLNQIKKMGRLGVVCTTIPLTHLWLRGAQYLGNPRNAGRAVPHKTLSEKEIPFALGTDNKPYNPFHTMWAAVVRTERKTGKQLGPGQCLSPFEALKALTLGGAYLCAEENRRGSLEKGKLADLAVLSADPLRTPHEGLLEIHSILTIVGGKTVFDAGILT